MADKWIQLMNEAGTDNLFPTTHMDLLWANASPSSNFNAQTIALDLSNYKTLVIASRAETAVSNLTNCICKVGSHNTVYSADINTGVPVKCRLATIDTTGVVFGNGYTQTSSNNAMCIPVEIYGIK